MLSASCDPRINRLAISAEPVEEIKKPLDQFETYEVFQQKKPNMPYGYVGPVHAPNLEMAFVFAKEQYSRRATCKGLWLAATNTIHVSFYTDDNQSVYDLLRPAAGETGNTPLEAYEIFHLKKRGKAHNHVGTVQAYSPEEALQAAKENFAQEPCVNIWVVRTADLYRTDPANEDIWLNTSEKKYREAAAYKVMEKINQFKQLHASNR
ncbi:phenylacetic acid degradation b [Adhaeribacter radiodurans]|uniref:Phenylacetic acid degradation b n=1 Tax=Adhaeribacter radiodurans TaxID=2745197 RepID=A0A7L7L8Y4_9BACT|nr:phenylacetic acid degradation b [Adhaeribacter radiodurans]QMU29184.1 phenylacetic acid degradation b [Adhaeribacter radiodurans]